MKIVIIIAVAITVCLVLGYTRQTKPKSHREVVRAALNRLLSRPSGAFVIFQDAQSGKFVQFRGSIEEPLLLDLPSQTLSPDEMTKAKTLFSELGYP